jgi:hypothetical protein
MGSIDILGDGTQDVGELTRSLRMALLVVDAALPLAGAIQDGSPVSAGLATEDRSHLRGIAFRVALRELDRFEYTIRPSDLEALMDGRVPEPGPAD